MSIEYVLLLFVPTLAATTTHPIRFSNHIRPIDARLQVSAICSARSVQVQETLHPRQVLWKCFRLHASRLRLKLDDCLVNNNQGCSRWECELM